MQRINQFLLNFKYAFALRKPRLTARLVMAVFRSVVLKRPPLRYVDFALDFPCNLRCEHCFAVSLKQQGRRAMSIRDYARVADECIRLGCVNFSFQGGEPLLFTDLDRAIAACRPDRNVISVTTNGTLLSEHRINELKNLGVDILTVSLDSADPDEHDRFRGVAGAFQKSLSGIRLALKAGLRVTIGAVVTHQTLRSPGIQGLLRLAQELRTLLYLILPVPAGRWANNREILLTAEDLRYIGELTRSSAYIRTDFQANLGPCGCGAVKEILYITPYGDVLPCPFLHISPGNIFESSVGEIRRRALEISYFSRYHQRCLVSTDSAFIDRYLSRTFDAPSLPLPWQAVFPQEVRP